MRKNGTPLVARGAISCRHSSSKLIVDVLIANLEIVALLGILAGDVKNRVDELSALGVVALGLVVAGELKAMALQIPSLYGLNSYLETRSTAT